MVKNTTGGNRAKRDARKHVGTTPNEKDVRYMKEEGEMYAIIKKVYGGGMCDAMCLDGKSRLCIIRNKFKGRGRSQNSVDTGCWALVGIRDWEVRKDGRQVCDLLTVYTSSERDKLVQKGDIDFSALLGVLKELNEEKKDSGSSAIEFSNTTEVAYQEMLSNRDNKASKDVGLVDEDMVNIDDI
jgi:initiation factor 1A